MGSGWEVVGEFWGCGVKMGAKKIPLAREVEGDGGLKG